MSISNQAQHFKLARRQFLLPEMFGDNTRYVRGYVSLTSGNSPDDFQQFVFRRALEDIPAEPARSAR